MLLSPETVQSIQNLLASLAGTDINDSFIEVEARFGNFSGSRFESGVDRRTFVRIREFVSQINPKFTFTHSKDEIFTKSKDTETSERYTTILDNEDRPTQSFWTIKEKIRNFDIPEYFLRISVSRETNRNEPRAKTPVLLWRDKKRWSFEFYERRFRLDLTEVTTYYPQNKDPKLVNTVYEIEVEVMMPKAENLPYFETALVRILKEVQGTLIIYTSSEKREIISRINQYLGSRKNNPYEIDSSVLANARDLKARDLVVGGIVPGKNRNVQYSVTIKADGIRKLMVIDKLGIYLVMSPSDVSKILGPEASQRLTWHGTVFEGELIPRANLSASADSRYRKAIIYYLMYDTLTVGETKQDGSLNVRNVRGEDHPTRLEYIERFLRNVRLTTYIFEKKVFRLFSTPNEFYRMTNLTLDESYPFKTDGLVYTPSNYQYDSSISGIPISKRKLTKYPDIVKWKPPQNLTIDFQINHVASPEGNYVELLSLNSARRGPGKTYDSRNTTRDRQRLPTDSNLIRFEGTERYPFNPRTQVLISDMIRRSPNGTILEFQWVPNDPGQLEAIRVRIDKDRPNREDVAKDVWEDIHSPVDEGTIRGAKFSLIFRYHNREKWKLFDAVANALPKVDGTNIKTRTLLSIGSGKGGDVDKWVTSGFTHIICVEPNEENRNELQRRLSATTIRYLIIPTVGQDVDNIVTQVRKFAPNGAVEVVSYMLSLSFFFDNPQSTLSILNLVNQTLMYGGYFIAFTIDGRYVLDFFRNPTLYKMINTIMVANFSMIDFELRPPSNETPTPHILINIPNSIVQNQIEYLTNIPELQQILSQAGLDLISETRAIDEQFMTNEELYYTQFFTSFIMRRKESAL